MGQVYASSDWHGSAEPAKKLLSYLKDDDILYYLGDAIDRGDDGIELLNLLIKDPRVIFLRGNHEEFMQKSILEKLDDINLITTTFYLWVCNNGGNKTWSDIELLNKEELLKYVMQIKHMPLSAEYESPKGHKVILEHAGFTPGVSDKFHDPLWDRDHFYEKWSKDAKFKNTYVIHGHTPVQYLQFHYGYIDQLPLTKEEKCLQHTWMTDSPINAKWYPEIIRYCDGHKFDIDMCTAASGRVALLNLDTFETIYFDKNKGD